MDLCCLLIQYSVLSHNIVSQSIQHNDPMAIIFEDYDSLRKLDFCWFIQ